MFEQGTGVHIATATTTAIKSGSGVLHTLTVNTTAAGIVTVYDDTAATGGREIAILKASVAEQTFIFDVVFRRGLTIVTAAASDLTVSFQ
jgi:hypothetical protein